MKPKTKAQLRKMFEWVGGCSEGLYAVRLDEKEFHVHPDGTPAYEQRFDYVSFFQGGVAEVRDGSRTFRIHPDGTPVA